MKERSQDNPIDQDILQILVEMIGDSAPGEMPHLLDDFLAESARQVKNMRECLTAGDHVTLHRLAHNLKSSSAMFGAVKLSEFCLALEKSAGAGCPNGLGSSLVEQLTAEHCRATEALHREKKRLLAE